MVAITLAIFLAIWSLVHADYSDTHSKKTKHPKTQSTELKKYRGYKGLYMGHSFFKPSAMALSKIIPETKVMGHEQTVVFNGGKKGSPKELWRNNHKRKAGQKALDSGEIDLLVMTYFSVENSSAEHYGKWFDYAIEKNPRIVFVVTIPWATQLYKADLKAIRKSVPIKAMVLYKSLILKLREMYPQNKVLYCPYGYGTYELMYLLNEDKLPGVKYVLNPKIETRRKSAQLNEQLLNDPLGHPGELVSMLGALLWLQTIYDYDLSELKPIRVQGLPRVDLNAIASEVNNEINPFNAVYKEK